MADNLVLNAGSGGSTLATDDIGSVHYQISKLAFGPLNTATLVTSSVGFPVDLLAGTAEIGNVKNSGTFAVQAVCTNAGTFAVQSTLSAETTKVIGTINVAAAQTIATTNVGTFATQATLQAGTAGIGKLTANSGVDIGDVDVTSIVLPGELSGPLSPTIDSYVSASVSAAAATADQELVAIPGASKQIWVYGFVGTADTGDGSISLQDEDDVALSGVMPVVQNGGFAVTPSGNFAMPWLKVATNKALEIDTLTCGFKGVISYAIVSV